MFNLIPEQYRVAALVVAGVVIAAVSALLTSWYWADRLADERARTAEFSSAYNHATQAITAQNAAAQALNDDLVAQRKAGKAVEFRTKQRMRDLQAEILDLRAERPDDPQDLCASASSAFDAELKRERGQ